jgi:hypothetical protein
LLVTQGKNESDTEALFGPHVSQVAIGSFSQMFRLLEVNASHSLMILQGHIYRLVISRSPDETIKLWDVQTGQGVKLFSCYHLNKGCLSEIEFIYLSWIMQYFYPLMPFCQI